MHTNSLAALGNLLRCSRGTPASLASRCSSGYGISAAVGRSARPLSTSAVRFCQGSHMMDETDPQNIEREKQRVLKGESISPCDQAPQWNGFLASEAEAIVKAEQESDVSVKELQSTTKHWP
ncbi:hypothetical protein EV182_003894, partial [Spiromyces aspiralis]